MPYRLILTTLKDPTPAGFENFIGETSRAFKLPPEPVRLWAQGAAPSLFSYATREASEQARAYLETMGATAEVKEGAVAAPPPPPLAGQPFAPPAGVPGSAPGPYAPQPRPAGGLQDDRLLAMLCHLTSFGGYLFPFANIIIPLVLWLVKKDESPLIDLHGKESVNFQISVTIYAVVGIVLAFVLIGFVLLLALVVFQVVVVILASIKAYNGEPYRYPLCIRFIK
jgi:hypothetical protein